jgi:hypothetical protein
MKLLLLIGDEAKYWAEQKAELHAGVLKPGTPPLTDECTKIPRWELLLYTTPTEWLLLGQNNHMSLA